MRYKLPSLTAMLFCFILLPGCEEETNTPDRYLMGTYALVSLAENEVSLSNTAAVLNLETPDDTITTVSVFKNDTLLNETRFFQDGVDGVEGTAILNNDLTAYLEGSLFSNINTLCNPIIILASFASSGIWAVNEEQGTFELNLETDALDIEGLFNFDETSGLLTIQYTTIDEADSIKISQVTQNNVTWDIESTCLPVTSSIDRKMILKLEN